jgi:hypothetical protein
LVAEAIREVAKPIMGMGRQSMPPSRPQKKPIELFQEGATVTFFIRELFAFCPSDLPLCAILVQPTKDLLEPGSEIDGVQIGCVDRLRPRWRDREGGP